MINPEKSPLIQLTGIHWAFAVGLLGAGLFLGLMIPRGADSEKSESESTPGESDALHASLTAEERDKLDRVSGQLEATRELSLEWFELVETLPPFEKVGRLHASLVDLPSTEFPKMMDELGQFWGTSDDYNTRHLIGSRWAAVDPQGMLAYIESHGSGLEWHFNQILFSTWAKTDPAGAFSAAMTVSGSQSRESAVSAYFSANMELDPKATLAQAADFYRVDVETRGTYAYKKLLEKWAVSDPQAARAFARAIEDDHLRSNAIKAILEVAMERDPMEAITWLQSLEEDVAVSSAKQSLYTYFGRLDFHSAVEALEKIDDPVLYQQLVGATRFNGLSSTMEFDEILEVYIWLTSEVRVGASDLHSSVLFQEMAKSNPERAIELASQLEDERPRERAIRSVADVLFESDIERAISFISDLDFESEKRAALGVARMGNPVLARRFAKLIGPEADPLVQRILAPQIASGWSAFDHVAALDWSLKLPDQKTRDAAVTSVLGNWLQREPEAAIRFVEVQSDEGEALKALEIAFARWSDVDPRRAIQWVDALPAESETVRGRYYHRAATRLLSLDAHEASIWIESLDRGSARDSAVDALVNHVSKSDPEAGLIWAATIGDESQRRNSLRRSVRAWLDTDPRAAFEAVKDANITAEEKAPLLQLFEGTL